MFRLDPAGLETAAGDRAAEVGGFLAAAVVGVLGFDEGAGRALGVPAAGRAFFAPCVDGAPGFTAVFLAGAETGPSEDMERLIVSP